MQSQNEQPDASSQVEYWRLFNASARFVGFVFLIVGTIVGLFELFTEFPRHELVRLIQDQDSTEMALKSAKVGFPLIVAWLGYKITQAKPYYPRTPR